MYKITESQTMIEIEVKNHIVHSECEIMPYIENSWKVQVWIPIYINNGYMLHRVKKTIISGVNRLKAQKVFNKEFNKINQ